jgi:hypothetical protein
MSTDSSATRHDAKPVRANRDELDARLRALVVDLLVE